MSATATVKSFYDAFTKMDASTMAALYAPNATFSDEVFINLNGSEAGQMWQMLCTRSKDLNVTYEIKSESENVVTAVWQAYYTFSKTGRKVHNVIEATLEVRDGKIVSHRDRFDFWKWSIQALGPIGILLGWTPLVKSKVRKEAAHSLDSFMRRSS